MAHRNICYQDIQLAACGDSEAMQKVLRHFRPYIKDLSVRIRESGNGEMFLLDYDKVDVIESHLMEAITKFDLSRILSGSDDMLKGEWEDSE